MSDVLGVWSATENGILYEIWSRSRHKASIDPRNFHHYSIAIYFVKPMEDKAFQKLHTTYLNMKLNYYTFSQTKAVLTDYMKLAAMALKQEYHGTEFVNDLYRLYKIG